jgi:TctA family transporter
MSFLAKPAELCRIVCFFRFVLIWLLGFPLMLGMLMTAILAGLSAPIFWSKRSVLGKIALAKIAL